MTERPTNNSISFDQITGSRVLIVDDEPVNCKIARRYLELEGIKNTTVITDSREAMDRIRTEEPDLVLLDLMMPHVSGLDILREIHATPRRAFLPVLVLTASSEPGMRSDALSSGATDFLNKPIDATEFLPRVKNLLWIRNQAIEMLDHAKKLELQVRLKTAEVEQSRQDIVHCLGRAAEYRDNETGLHVVRVGRYVGVLARAMGLDESVATLYEQAAPLHDVGKIGIPDEVLLKPGKLDPDEFDIMRRHCAYGSSIIGQQPTKEELIAWRQHTDIGSWIFQEGRYPLLEVAAAIAQSHHEKWDGSGYPIGLSGEDIPLAGRITAVADTFDALSSKRPYKPAYPLDKTLGIMRSERGKHFDPSVMDAFERSLDDIVAISVALREADGSDAEAA